MASAPTYESIAYQSLVGTAASITFSSIAASWTDLRVVLTATTTVAGQSTTINLNGDTATNYSYRYMRGNGTTATSLSSQGAGPVNIQGSANTSTTIPTLYSIDIFQYANTGMNKTFLYTTSEDQNGSGSVTNSVGLWRSTAAITSIVLTSSGLFAIGTTAELIGVKSA